MTSSLRMALGIAGVLALLAASAAVALWWLGPGRLINALSAIDSQRAATAQAYGPLARQRYDLYLPRPAASGRPAPLVVFLYGGAWNRGERADYRFVGEALARRGVAVMVADYRLHPEVRYPDFLHDSAGALVHAMAMAPGWGADPARLFVMGHSAGAYNAAMLALDPRWLVSAGSHPSQLAGWIGLAGPYDFLPIRTPEVQAVFHHPQVPLDSQPIRHVRADAPPTLIVSPLQDERIDAQRNSAGLAAALRASGAGVDLRRYAGVDHVSVLAAMAWPLRGLAPVLDDCLAFITAPRRGP